MVLTVPPVGSGGVFQVARFNGDVQTREFQFIPDESGIPVMRAGFLHCTFARSNSCGGVERETSCRKRSLAKKRKLDRQMADERKRG